MKRLLSLATLAGSLALVTADPCDPSHRLRDGYTVDFRKETSVPGDWILADQAHVSFSDQMGANFSFTKRYDAPYIWTKNYLLFGRVEVELQCAPGNGLITGFVLMSDNKDELDWEWSGNNFRAPNGVVQTNYFGKGITGNYDRGTQENVEDPSSRFHTYAFDWKPEKVTWEIDGKVIRTLENKDTQSGDYQYPQTPSRVHLGIWNAGDPDTPEGVQNWAGGEIDMKGVPYSAYIRSAKITPYKPCLGWKYPDNFSGKWNDVVCTNQSVTHSSMLENDVYSDMNNTAGANQTVSASSTVSTSFTASPRPTQHTIMPGDTCYAIAQKYSCATDEIKKANQHVNCDMLVPGTQLTIPGNGQPVDGTQSASSTSNGASATSGGTISSPTTLTGASSGCPAPMTTTVTATITATVAVQGESSTVCSPSVTATMTVTSTITSTHTLTLTLATNTPALGLPGTSTPTVSLQSSINTVNANAAVTSSGLTSAQNQSTNPGTTSDPAALPIITVSQSSSVAPSSPSSFAVTPVTTATTDSQGSIVTVTNTTSVTTVVVNTTMTSMLTFTITEPCTVCSTYTVNGQTTASCSKSMDTTTITTAIITTAPVITVASVSPSETQTTSLISIPTTPPVSTITVPCSSCSEGSTTITSTCSTYIAETTVTVPCGRCSDGSTTITSTTTHTYTEGPPTSSSTVDAVTPECTASGMTTCSTAWLTTTSCQPGKTGGDCPITSSASTTCAPTICTNLITQMTPTGGVTTTTAGCKAPMTTCSMYMTSSSSCSEGQSLNCPVTSSLATTCDSEICTQPYTTPCTSPGTTCSTSMVMTTSCSPEKTTVCPSVTTSSTTCASTICYTPPPPPSTTSSTTSSPSTTTTSISSTTSTTTSTTTTITTTVPSTTSSITTTNTTTTTTTTSTTTITPNTPSTSITTTTTTTTTSTTTSAESTTSSTTTTETTSSTTPPPLTSTMVTSTIASSTIPTTCTTDACFNQLFNENNIDEAHNDARGFCANRGQAIPTYVNMQECAQDRGRLTSAFQCITASATPVPSEFSTAAGRNCYTFGGKKIWGARNQAKVHRKIRRDNNHMPVGKAMPGRAGFGADGAQSGGQNQGNGNHQIAGEQYNENYQGFDGQMGNQGQKEAQDFGEGRMGPQSPNGNVDAGW